MEIQNHGLTPGSRPWLELYRRSAAKQHNENKILVSGGI